MRTLPLIAAACLACAAESLAATQLVLFAPDTAPPERRRLAEAAGAVVVRELPFIDALVVRVPPLAPQALQALKASRGVEAVEDDAYRRWLLAPAPEAGPFPPLPSLGQALAPRRGWRPRSEPADARAGEVPWGVQRVNAPAAWSRGRGEGAVVAVVDTGIDRAHPDLEGRVAGGMNVLDPASPADDDHGHGTHVAGTIAAEDGDGGVAGVAPRARLLAVKVLDGSGGGMPSSIVAGIAWATEHGAHVINMSLGGPSSAALRRAVQAAAAAGVTIVAATGNDPESPVAAPARYPETLAVTASVQGDGLAPFSSVGPEVDFIAPGRDIPSDAPGGRLAVRSGTSMAAPHVAGLAALAVSFGARGPAQVRAWLEAAAKPLSGLTREQQGAGLIDAARLGQ
ncbi:MAG: S8 family serine peptidase [Elusimicrobia bacterium]|nr:S8 family serine peptidase [Elusimicrobiota bacterium]